MVSVLNVDVRSEFLVYIFRVVACVQESGGFTVSEEASPTSSEYNSVGEVSPEYGTNCKPSFCRRIMANHKKSVAWSVIFIPFQSAYNRLAITLLFRNDLSD